MVSEWFCWITHNLISVVHFSQDAFDNWRHCHRKTLYQCGRGETHIVWLHWLNSCLRYKMHCDTTPRHVLLGKKFVTYFFIEKTCCVLPICYYIYCSRTLLVHLNFNTDFKIVTLSFLVSTQNLVILNENSQNLMKKSMVNRQIVWVIIKKTPKMTLEW